MKVIIHCSDSKFGNAALIAKWHVMPKPNGNGWDNIGYHYVILNGHLSSKAFNQKFDGHLETGRPLDEDNLIEPFEIGAHTKGFNNAVGVCLVGHSGVFTSYQLDSLHSLLDDLKKQFGTLELFQHSDLDSKKPNCAGLEKFYFGELKKIYE